MLQKVVQWILLCLFCGSFMANADEVSLPPNSSPVVEDIEHHINQWMSDYLILALEKQILANINGFRQVISGRASDHDVWGLPGGIVAAPSVEFDADRYNPNTGKTGEWQDYRGTWKRDSALTMRMVFRLMTHGPWKDWPFHKKLYAIRNYANFTEFEQGTHRLRLPIDWGGDGDESMLRNPLQEPEFDLARAKVNPFSQENVRQWGEPQDDGPPLQILALLDGLKVVHSVPVAEALYAQDVVNRASSAI